MIFDERDLEKKNKKEKKVEPSKGQASFDELLNKINNAKKENTKNIQSIKSIKTSAKKIDSTYYDTEQEKTSNIDDDKKKSDRKDNNHCQNNIIEKKKDAVHSSHTQNYPEDKQVNEDCVGDDSLRENNVSDSDLQVDEDVIDEEGNISKSLRQVIHEAMIPYSEYVILDRALPRVEDGLKPVQRRILYSMYELGLTPDKPFKKSAKVVGDCMANYHPHGDSSIYNAMVRMSQDFNMRDPLVKGHGNFGSMDGDGAAAMRYTESKLSDISMMLLKDIDKNTVEYIPNYDDSKKEPSVLTGKFPNLLVNGSSGIAVGLATNIPPHNLGETINAVVSYIENKKISTEELMKNIKGPDFPMGGLILGTEGIKDAFETGKGRIILRAKIHIESDKGKPMIVIDEFPYQVNKSLLLAKISSLVDSNKDVLGSITDIRDESDRNGVRSVICLRKSSDTDNILNFLYKHTDLQTSFSINMVAIADSKPRLLNLKNIIEYYTEYQRQIIYKRTAYDLEMAKAKEHILSGLFIAIKNIDEVVDIIKSSESSIIAKNNLISKFRISDKQAQAILDMRLARLTNLELTRLQNELEDLNIKIKKYSLITGSKKRQMTIVKKELLEIKKSYSTKRRTQIVKDADELLDLNEENFEPIKDVVIAINSKNCIKKITQKSFNLTGRIVDAKTKLNEVHNILVSTETDKLLYAITNYGNCHKIDTRTIIEGKWRDKGNRAEETLDSIKDGENIISVIPCSKETEKDDLLLFSKNGFVKKISIKELDIKKQSYEITKLKDGDELIAVDIYKENKDMIFITKEGMALRAETSDLTSLKRSGQGVMGIKLNKQDTVIHASSIEDNDVIVMVTNKGYSKKLDAANFDTSLRYRKGVKAIDLTIVNGLSLEFVDLCNHNYQIYTIDKSNKVLAINTMDIEKSGRVSKGKLNHKGKKPIKVKNILKYEWESKTY